MFRLGRLLPGGARGPGVFFIIPCVDIYEKIDMRTQTFDVPPQEVNIIRKDFFSSQEWKIFYNRGKDHFTLKNPKSNRILAAFKVL